MMRKAKKQHLKIKFLKELYNNFWLIKIYQWLANRLLKCLKVIHIIIKKYLDCEKDNIIRKDVFEAFYFIG